MIAGTAIPAISAIPTGAPTNMPNCHIIFFFLLQGFLPQNVQPDGLQKKKRILNIKYVQDNFWKHSTEKLIIMLMILFN